MPRTASFYALNITAVNLQSEMTFDEIIQKLRDRDDRVTQCFFFWDGPTLKRIEEIRRTDPKKAAQLRKPVCNTCKPALLKVLHSLYGTTHFNYEELVSDFYLYLIQDDKLASIKEPKALMGWIVSTAYYFFLHEKIKEDKMLENTPVESLNLANIDVEVDEEASKTREFVECVLAAMPNRTYAKILDEVTLEVGQYRGQQKSDRMRQLAEQLEIPIDNLYVKVSLAKKQFKETAKRLNLI